MELLVLAVFGVILAVLSLFILMRKIESAIFYSILLGPALGSSIGNFFINLFAGDMGKAVESFKFLPFFLTPIDEAFFGATANELLIVVGAVILGLWAYVFLHFLASKFGIWSLPILPAIFWVAGLSLANIRIRLMTIFPPLSFLLESLYGLPALLLICFVISFLCYLYWRRTESHELELPLPDKLKFRD